MQRAPLLCSYRSQSALLLCAYGSQSALAHVTLGALLLVILQYCMNLKSRDFR